MSASKPIYHYMSSGDYVSRLRFDYIETYSFQRGQDFDDRQKEFAFLSNRRNRTSEQQKRLTELLQYSNQAGLLLNEEGQFDTSSVRIKTFTNNSIEIEQISTILKIQAIDIPTWMCAPFYRDAIVFYNAAYEIVFVLNICFSCEYMATKEFHHINADTKTYKALRNLFVNIGHPIEIR